MKKAIVVILVCLGCVSGLRICGAQEVKFPAPRGFVNDTAGVMKADARSQLEALLTRVQEKTGAEVAVLTVQTTQPLTIEQYAVEIFQKWGIGQKGVDNGILLLVAVSDRKVRIEVGYGLEGAVTDLQSKVIIEELILPAFRKGNYSLGITSGTVMLVQILRDEYGVDLDLGKEGEYIAARGKAKSSPLGSLLTLLFFILIFGMRFGTLFFIMGGGGGYWSSGSSGSFGGGFGGFGGGMSGGGGASGGW